MAFNFVKKIFSFGRKQVEEVAPDAPASDAPPAPFPEIGPAQSRQIPETPETPVRPAVDETPPEHPHAVGRDAEASPAAEEKAPALPPAEVLPPIREPEPIAPDPLHEEIAPEATAAPTPAPERDIPPPASGAPAAEPQPAEPEVSHPAAGTPSRQPEPAPREIAPEKPAVPPELQPDISARKSSPATQEIAPEAPPADIAPPEAPVSEILPPIREPESIASDPLREEIAPEAPSLPLKEGVSAKAEGAAAEDELESPPPANTAPGAASESAGTQIAPPVQPPRPDKVTVAKKVEARAAPAATPAPAPRQSWFQRMRAGLSRSSRELSDNIAGVFTKRKLDEETLQDLEDVLIRADLGMETAIRVTDALASGRFGRDISDSEVRAVMATEMEKVLSPVALPLELDLSHKPHVVLVVGVNGTGKTTTIGKLAAKLADGGLSVMLAAGDTFRAAAIEQLKIWGERTGAPVVASKLGADAAGLAWDAFERAKEAGSDVLIIDTAGRLQNKAELMAELEKIVRVLGKLDPEAPHTVLQTVDATTGQNALNQVEIFRNVAGVNGLVMTKLDGTARGGILVAIAAKHKLPVYFIGVGEQVDDLEPFSANEFARAIAGVN